MFVEIASFLPNDGARLHWRQWSKKRRGERERGQKKSTEDQKDVLWEGNCKVLPLLTHPPPLLQLIMKEWELSLQRSHETSLWRNVYVNVEKFVWKICLTGFGVIALIQLLWHRGEVSCLSIGWLRIWTLAPAIMWQNVLGQETEAKSIQILESAVCQCVQMG